MSLVKVFHQNEFKKLLAEILGPTCAASVASTSATFGDMQKYISDAYAAVMIWTNYKGLYYGGPLGVQCLRTGDVNAFIKESGRWRMPSMFVCGRVEDAEGSPKFRYTDGMAVAAMDHTLYVAGGISPGCGTNFLCFSLRDLTWRELSPLTCARWGSSLVGMDGMLHICGGIRHLEVDKSSTLSLTERFDPTTNAWERLSDMHTSRSHFGGAGLRGCLYACGGGADLLSFAPTRWRSLRSSAERFEPTAKRWVALPDMHVPRVDCSITCAGGFLYVLGGQGIREGAHLYQGAYDLDSVERFDPRSLHWEVVLPMSTPRLGHVRTAHCGQIFVLGGLQKQGDEESVIYDDAGNSFPLHFDDSTGKWVTLPLGGPHTPLDGKVVTMMVLRSRLPDLLTVSSLADLRDVNSLAGKAVETPQMPVLL